MDSHLEPPGRGGDRVVAARSGLPSAAVFAIGTVFLAGVLAMAYRSGSRFIVVVAVLLIVTTVRSAGRHLRTVRAAVSSLPAEIVLPDQPLRLGQQLEVVYRRASRRQGLAGGVGVGVGVGVGAGVGMVVELLLVCEEKVVYMAGTDRKVRRERVVERSFTGQGFATPAGIEATVLVEVPVDQGGPTMSLPSNEISWWIEARVSGAAASDDHQQFALRVDPALHARMTDLPARSTPIHPPPPAAGGPAGLVPTVSFQLERAIARPGGVITGQVSRTPPLDDRVEPGGAAKAEGLAVRLHYRTEGRGMEATGEFGTYTFPVDSYGRSWGSFSFAVPVDAPISYDGSLIRVLWEVEARVVIRWGRDERHASPVVVVPWGGEGLYWQAHPLRTGWGP